MNAPHGQNQDEDNIDLSDEAATRPLLRTTRWAGHRQGAFERILYRIHASLRPVIAANLSQEHAFLFAEPVSDEVTGDVHWYSPVEGAAVAYNELASEDQTALGQRVNQLLFDLLELARQLQTKATTKEEYVAGELLQLQLDSSFPETDYLYVVGFQPVVAFWAFESDRPPDQAEAQPQAPSRAAAPAAAKAAMERVGDAFTATWPRQTLSPRTFGILAAALAVVFLGVFGLNPRETVISWLDRVEEIKALEQAKLREIARVQGAQAGDDVITGDLESALISAEAAAEAAGADVPLETDSAVADEGFYEPEPEPLPAFESTKGDRAVTDLPGAVLILHFWSNVDDEQCAQITSFASMVAADEFDALRRQGGEAYLVTRAESVEKGNELLRSCGVQDPFLLRDPEGRILARLSPESDAPITIVYDKEDEKVLAAFSQGNWLEPDALEKLRQLFLLRVF